jgi:hypothetical protein
MRTLLIRSVFPALIFGALFLPAAASAFQTSHVASDAEMLDLVQQFAFVAEGRIGDLGGAATFELDLGADTGAPAQTAQYNWPNGIPVPFIVHYDAGLDLVTFTVGANVLTYTPDPGFAEIFVRTRAVNVGSSIRVDNLFLNGTAVVDTSVAIGDGLDILRIAGEAIQNGFLLTGDATLSWTGSPPTQSRLAFQIKIASPAAVPVQSATWGSIKSLFE